MINYKKPKIVAEIGCNHKGEIEVAKQLICKAKECGADVAKFQKRSIKNLLSEEQYNMPHPNPYNSYGKTYGEHREYLEFNIFQHSELKQFCEQIGIEYSTSVWDLPSAIEIISIKPKFIKVPSASNINFDLLKILRDNFNGEVHISTGMTTKAEEEAFVKFFEQTHQSHRLVVYSCTSGYPVPFEDICLLEISRLRSTYTNRINALGFSGHHLGIAIDIAAYTLGAEIIERHFTLDRTWKGTDHAASLEPDGLKKLVRNLEATHLALTVKKEEILEIEKVQRNKLKYKS